jgi:hypothetical protein
VLGKNRHRFRSMRRSVATALTAVIDAAGNSRSSPVDTNPDTNLRERRRTCTTRRGRESPYLQPYLSDSEHQRRHHSAFARRRSGVRIPSAPLTKVPFCRTNLTGKQEPWSAPGNSECNPLLSRVFYGAARTSCTLQSRSRDTTRS